MKPGVQIESLNVKLDPSVKSITKVAAFCLSGYIANGLVLSQNPNSTVVICKDRIEFGKCCTPAFQGMSGRIYLPNYYIEYGNIVYRYDNAWKISLLDKQLDYQGFLAPSKPDNPTIFQLIYPRFA